MKQSDVCSFFCVFTFEREKTVLEAHVARKKRLLLQKKSGFFVPASFVFSNYACENGFTTGGVWLNPKPFGPPLLSTLVFCAYAAGEEKSARNRRMKTTQILR